MTNLSDWRAGRSLKIAAVAAAFIFTCIALAVTPIADLPLTRSMIGFAVLMTWSATALGLTSLFLNAQTRGNRLYAQAVLAIGYGFAALMMIPYDVFSPGMFGDLSARLRMQPHGTEWLNLLWHFGLIAGVVGYHLINWAHPSGVYWSGGRRVVGRIFSASCWLFFVSIFVALWWPLPALVIDGHLAALSRFILIPALMAF